MCWMGQETRQILGSPAGNCSITTKMLDVKLLLFLHFAQIWFTKDCEQGRRNTGRAWGAVKVLRAMKTCKKQKYLPIMLVIAQQQR